MDIKTQAEELYEKILALLRGELERAVKNLDQDEVADLCGTSQGQISRILNHKRGKEVSFRTVVKIALGLNLDLPSLLLHDPLPDKEKLKTLLDQISKMIA